MTSIGSSAFYGCSSLLSVSIPNNVTSIIKSAFEGCNALTEVIFEDGDQTLNIVGNGYLFNDSPLEKVYLGRNLSYNNDYSPFRNQVKLVNLTIGDCVTSIGNSLFKGCSKLNSVTIGKMVNSIDDNAFEYFAKKHCLFIVKNEDLEFILDLPNNILKDFINVVYEDNDKHQYIPLIFFGVGRLYCPNAFYTSDKGCLIDIDYDRTQIYNQIGKLINTYLNDEDISEQLMQESGYTFNPNLSWKNNVFYTFADDGDISREVTLTNAGDLFNVLGVQNIQKIEYLKISGEINGTDVMTLNRMTSLKRLDISDAKIVEGGVTYRDNLKTKNDEVGSYFFYSLNNLDFVALSKSANKICNNVFSDKNKLKNIFIPNSVISIEQAAFSGCSSLMSITIPNSVTSISDNAFRGCNGLTKVIFEDGIKSMEIILTHEKKGNIFEDTPLEEVYLGRNIYSHYGDILIFKGQINLTELTIGDNVTSIASSAFSGCSSLASVTIGNSVTSIGSLAFYGCRSLASVTIPNSVTSIGNSAFYGCRSLASVIIPDNVTSINGSTFEECSALRSVTIGNSVKSIGDNAFSGCLAIEEILSLNPTPPVINTSVFNGVDKENCKLLVTKGNLVYYWLDPVWKEFINISDDLLSLNMLPNVKYGDAPVDLTEYAPQGYTLKYESTNDNVARLDGTLLTICGAGEATIVASFPEEGSAMRLVGQMRQFIVDKANLEISAPNYTREYGKENPDIVFSYDGFVYDEDESALDIMPTATIMADENSEEGEYVIVISGAEAQNYNISYKNAKLIIIPSSSGVNSINDDVLKFCTENNCLVIEGAEGKDVQIYTLSGLMVFNGKEYRIPLSSGVYIVKIGNKRTKIKI